MMLARRWAALAAAALFCPVLTRGCLPRRDSLSSHLQPAATQLSQGTASVTLHLTRRVLHWVQACLARLRSCIVCTVRAWDDGGALLCYSLYVLLTGDAYRVLVSVRRENGVDPQGYLLFLGGRSG